MELIDTVVRFLLDPALRPWLVGVTCALLLVGMVVSLLGPRVVAKGRGVAIGGDNTGQVITGEVKGDVHQSINDSRPETPQPHSGGKEFHWLGSLCSILGLLLAVWLYFNPPAI